MTKKTHCDTQDAFIRQEIEQITASFETENEKIQKAIDDFEKSVTKQDSHPLSVEDRDELLFLRSELRHIEERFYEKVSKIKIRNR